MNYWKHGIVTIFLAFLASVILGQTVKGYLNANGVSGTLSNVVAYEVDSTTEPGYLDIMVLLSDREVPREIALNTDKLEELTREKGLVALRVILDPDCKIKSAVPYHPTFKTYIQSGVFIRWEPSAYNEKNVAGRFYTDGEQELVGQRWSYDITFSTPIHLDPAAKTVPK